MDMDKERVDNAASPQPSGQAGHSSAEGPQRRPDPHALTKRESISCAVLAAACDLINFLFPGPTSNLDLSSLGMFEFMLLPLFILTGIHLYKKTLFTLKFINICLETYLWVIAFYMIPFLYLLFTGHFH